MRKDKAIVSFSTSFGDVERVNSQFSKVRIRVCYAGRNRRNEVISKETLERAAESSLRLVPLVGHYLPESDNFGGHDMALEIVGNELKLNNLTKAYGVVPENANFAWEEVTEKNGITRHEYLTCDGILWSGRYPQECDAIMRDGMNQSMEIMVNRWGVTEDGYDEIEDCEFAALCILGKSDDPAINVEPCYESASVQSYSLNNGVDEIMQAYLASLKEPEVVIEQVKQIAEADEQTHDVEECDQQAEDAAQDEQTECAECEIAESDSADEVGTESAIETESLEEDPTVDYESLLAAERATNASLNEELMSLRAEIEELRAYRQSVEEATVVATMREQFSDLEGDTEFESMLANRDLLHDVQSLTERCFALRGRKVSPKTQNNYQFRGVSIPIHATNEAPAPYGGIVDAYKRSKNI